MGSVSQLIVRLENGARRADKTQNRAVIDPSTSFFRINAKSWRQEHGIQAVADRHAVGMGADGARGCSERM